MRHCEESGLVFGVGMTNQSFTENRQKREISPSSEYFGQNQFRAAIAGLARRTTIAGLD
jgi:hypothetical protein